MPSSDGISVVIGAGVVGLAIARALALHGHEVVLVEAEAAVGTQTSSRSSEVVHAGIYYPPGSLKARLCVAGRALLYAYCQARDVPFRQTGKLIVATDARQQPQLEEIWQRAIASGVHSLQRLDSARALALEPALQCHSALFSPVTGIVDSHRLMQALQGDLEHAGGVVAFHSPVLRIEPGSHSLDIVTEDGTRLQASVVVNAAGHGAIALARQTRGLSAAQVPEPRYLKGRYFTLNGRAPFRHLIYPVPEPGGLGIHLTLDMAGQARFGPDVQPASHAGDLDVSDAGRHHFEAAVRRYWPQLDSARLQPDYAGMRPAIASPDGGFCDFIIQDSSSHGIAGLINLFGIESPGLTACLAIAEHVVQRLALLPR